ncbi:MAG TPA: YhfC family glutamic-type intramembrane protease [Nitrososphaerales archaeon]|nr:YhfC family glutamic-type intramembrane protease [Nitrososphaerales archaeon]
MATIQNIDPVFFLGPVVVVLLSAGLVFYWNRRRRLTVWALFLSAVAYFVAIGAKAAFQAVTYVPLDTAVGGNPWALGPYFGLQTVFLEVGLAYLVARYSVSHSILRANDAEGYGISLALWENGVFVAGLAALEYAIYFFTLSGGGTVAQQEYTALIKAAPSLFDKPTAALQLVGYQVLERVSSTLIHFSWGYLCVLAAVFKNRRYLLLALPWGLVDFLAPFGPSFSLPVFEGIIFTLALASVAVALASTRGETRAKSTDFSAPQPDGANLRLLFAVAFRRALNFGKVYVVIGTVLPLLFTVEVAEAGKAAAGAGGPALVDIYPLILPVFVVLGSTGALMVFGSDRDKGVFEYMLAYGVDVSQIFLSTVVATVGLVTLVLGVALVVSVASIAAAGLPLSVTVGELILFYTIPLSYASAMFMSMIGMIWSQLTARRPGVNSPVGIAPIVGIAPVLAALILAESSGPGGILYVAGGASAAMVCAVVLMAWVANKKMQRERFLSNA